MKVLDYQLLSRIKNCAISIFGTLFIIDTYMIVLRHLKASIAVLFASVSIANAQVEVVKAAEPKKNGLSWLNVKNDKRYIADHTKDLTVRIFSNSKFSRFVVGHNGYSERLPYATNDNLNIGAGFNWRFIGLNFGVKMPFVNSDNAKFGKTKGFDLQSFLYFRKLQIDLYAQSYAGLYVSRRKSTERDERDDTYPYRPDMKTRHFGINAQYIFNNRRFSYRAAFVQNEFQKKSAGSFIFGGGLYHFRAKGDSAIIPSNIAFPATFWDDRYNKTAVTALFVNAGYAYTLVVKKNFFATASFSVGPGLNYTSRRNEVIDDEYGGLDYQLNGTLRVAAGYNSPKYFVGVQYMRLTNKNGIPEPAAWQQFETGSFRVTIAKRFKLNRKFEKKVIEKIEEVTEDMEDIIR